METINWCVYFEIYLICQLWVRPDLGCGRGHRPVFLFSIAIFLMEVVLRIWTLQLKGLEGDFFAMVATLLKCNYHLINVYTYM